MITSGQHRRLCRARERLCDVSQPAASLREIAGEAGLSHYQFIRRFTAVFGETPHQYRQRHRLELAKRMLLLGNGSVTETCMAVGFSSLGSFSSLFKRRFRIPPSSFRRRAPTAQALEHHLPGCLTLMACAWQSQQQFSRSRPGTEVPQFALRPAGEEPP
jgi:AraC-like DNA-binding protein